MRTWQETHREGELLGEIDWSYDFGSHFDGYCTSSERKTDMLFTAIEQMWQVARLHEKGARLIVYDNEYGHELIAVGMYDGWPFWRPVPAVLVQGPIGPEWHHFPHVRRYEERP
jgi:hypothetical protein